jgi:hypothetical protein|tara:strand:- start:284 stop:1222 length:939 start_codon:yes stop_codon:yes gene_type:complete
MIQSYFLEKSPIIAGHYQDAIQASAGDRWDAGFDMSMTRENPTIAMYDFARFHVIDTDDLVDKETWEALYARPDTEWYDGMTAYQAEAIRDEYDYNLKDHLYGDMQGFNFAHTAGYFAGALLDPLNYLPWTRTLASTFRWISSSTKAMKFKRFVNPLKAKAETRADDIIDAMTGSVIGEGAIAGRKISHQTDYDLQTGIINIAMAGSIGAGVAGMRKVSDLLKKNSIDENLGAAAKALDDSAQGKPIEVNETAPPRPKTEAELEAEAPLEKAQRVLDDEWKLLSEEETVKAVFKSGKNIAKKMVDFIQCKTR